MNERLNCFRAVARTGGFSRAAEALHKTQPAISQAIRALEDDLEERLFLRLGREVRLTEAGEALLEYVERARAILERGRSELAARSNLEVGQLSLGTSDTNACYLLPPVLERYRATHPGIEVRISNRPSPMIERQVVEGDVDLGLVTLPASHSSLRCQPLMLREDVAIFSPAHPLAGRKRVRMRELFQLPLLLLDRGARTRAFIDDRARELAVVPHVAMELASVEVVKRLVAADFGVSIVPRIAIDKEIAEGSLACAALFRRDQFRELGWIHPRQLPLSRAASAFVTMAGEVLPDSTLPKMSC